MPDGNPLPGPGQPIAPMPEPARGGILRDPVDVRDRPYEPTLAALATERQPPEALVKALQDGRSPWGLPRWQGDEGTCGGQALAAIVDIERLTALAPEQYRASARMLYECARMKADSADGDDGISLRDVIKAFYNYGVCRDALWPYEPGGDPGQISVERARDARGISLGAYYRLRPNLNTYHAAINETGAVLVSAELHDGWLHETVRRNKGKIVTPDLNAGSGVLGREMHAFVLVGYTREGFLVLNSWGRAWGNWRPALSVAALPLPGVALWPYEDWANTVLDGWVLRLGVGAAEAFDYSIGDQGLGFGPDAPVRSTPVHAILGNFLHLDDGDYVHKGAYISTERTVTETLRLLAEDAVRPKPYEGVLLTFAGSLLGLKDAAEQVARAKRAAVDEGWYPFTLLWGVDHVDQSRLLLDGVFKEALERTGAPGARLDRLIEDRAHGIGRAIWRDLQAAADRAARPGGPLHQLVRGAAQLFAARPDFGLRIVAESEGAFALAALVRALRTEPFQAEAAPFFEHLHSVDLIAPPLGHADYAGLAMHLGQGWGREHAGRRIYLHLPTACDERRLAVPPYGASYFDLVARAFGRQCDLPAAPVPIVCDPATPDAIAPKWADWDAVPRTMIVPIRWKEAKSPEGLGPITQSKLLFHSDLRGRLRGILRRPAPRRRPDPRD